MTEKKPLNFRDISLFATSQDSEDVHIKPGMVFRSAELDSLSTKQVDELIEKHNIRTVLDLRSWDHRKNYSQLPIQQRFPVASLDSVSSLKSPQKQSLKEKESIQSIHNTVPRQSYHIDFVGKGFQRHCVWKSCPLGLKLKLIALLTFQQHNKAAIRVGKEIMTPMGISTMYKYLAITCQREILSVLRLFVDPCRYPILVHCSHGKDRTAIVIGLLLSIAGVSHDKIVEDYKYTQTALAEVYSELLDNIKGAGLSDEFADADPKNMDMLLSYLESTFGSIKDYLNAICFNEKEQEAIRANFVEKG